MKIPPHTYPISLDPMDRVPDAMKAIIDDPKVFFDTHCHVLNYQDVPDGYIGMRVPMNERFLVRVEKFLHNIIGLSNTDWFSRQANFLHFLHSRTSQELATQIADYYPRRKSILATLMLDLETGIKGKIKRPYTQQIEDMKILRDGMPDKILPFIGIDPNNPDAMSNFLKVFSTKEDYQFFGVKIYPSLGFLPSHPVLMDIFEVCEKFNIPVTGHCGSGRVHHSKKLLRNLPGLRQNDAGEWVPFKTTQLLFTKYQYSDFFNDPKNWEPVLAKYPKLKLNLAHFGGTRYWKKFIEGNHDNRVSQIVDMMSRYDYLYSDFSYTFYDQDFNHRLKDMIEDNQLLADRVLFGSDFYMIELEGKYRHILANFITIMGDKIMHQIGVNNPKQFLFGRTDTPVKISKGVPFERQAYQPFFG